jgi:CDP-6-deoxy-D-xylo-4-hexulose-3-dehydrase
MLDSKDINEILKFVDLKFNNKNFIDDFLPGKSNVPVSGKVIDKEDIKKMIEACLDGWLTTGRFNKMFEEKVIEFTGSKLAITVNSGSSANLLAFMTLTSEKLKERAIKTGDEIITVAAGFPTTVNPILQFGAIPVFIDIEIPTYNIDISKIEKAITKKTKAIMIAHTMGNPFDVKSVREICDKYNLWLIQDTCDALGAKFDNKKLGYYGDIGTVSFYPAHHITMGEGGLVYTNSVQLKRIAESFRDWGRDCYCEPGKDNTCKKRFEWKLGDLPFGYDHKYTYSHLGYNMKITDMQAACGLSQLNKLDQFINQRIINHEYLYKKFKKFEDYFVLPEKNTKSEPSWFGFLLTIKNKKIVRNDLIKYLDSNKIATRLLFAGNLVKQPYMKNLKYRIEGSLQNTETVMTESFWLGVYPGLSCAHLDYVSSVVENYIDKIR